MSQPIPQLMPNQMDAFNADFYIEQEFLKLRDRFKITKAVETGTCFGSSTLFLAKHFGYVATIEIVEQYLKIAKERFVDYNNINAYHGDSKALLAQMIADNKIGNDSIFFLDAHWGGHCPLPDELKAIAAAGISPVIAIHDFKVPGEPSLGFDTWDKQEFTFEWLQPYFDAIYGYGGYTYHYNSGVHSTQIKRGIIYVYPVGTLSAGAVATPTKTQFSAEPVRVIETKPKVVLYLNYYNDSSPDRQAELSQCLTHNILNQKIDLIYLVVDNPDANLLEFNKFSKVRVVPHYLIRPTYRYFFDLINSNVSLNNRGNEISIIANTDIYFDDTAIDLLHHHLKPAFCFALSAWDKTEKGELNILKKNVDQEHWVSKNDSQDAWIFRGPVKDVPLSDFSMGRPGCDNAIAASLEKAGYMVVNPALSIKIIHLHITGIRHYDTKDYSKIPGGKNPDRVYQDYKMVEPIGITDLPNPPDDAIGWIAEPITSPSVASSSAGPVTAGPVNWIKEIGQISATGGQESQFHEEAIIRFIFDHIGCGDKFFVDLGAGAYEGSVMSNTRSLKRSGWAGFGVDAADTQDEWVIKQFIKPDNVIDTLKQQNTPKKFAFLNLDLDSSDFWVLQRLLTEYKPRLICTEFNGTLDPNESVVLKYEDGYSWDRTSKYGYSFAAGKKLLQQNGYVIIYNQHQTNIFAVREDLLEGIEVPEVSAERNQYHPYNLNAVWETY